MGKDLPPYVHHGGPYRRFNNPIVHFICQPNIKLCEPEPGRILQEAVENLSHASANQSNKFFIHRLLLGLHFPP